MKGFFSRLHDSTQTGHSKSTSKDPYKIWTPAVDPEQEYAQPTITPGDVPAYTSTRQNVEKRSSSRPKPSYTVPIPSYEKYATTNATAGPSSEKIPDLGSRANPNIPPAHYSRVPPQVTVKATSTRYRDYSSDANKPNPLLHLLHAHLSLREPTPCMSILPRCPDMEIRGVNRHRLWHTRYGFRPISHHHQSKPMNDGKSLCAHKKRVKFRIDIPRVATRMMES